MEHPKIEKMVMILLLALPLGCGPGKPLDTVDTLADTDTDSGTSAPMDGDGDGVTEGLDCDDADPTRYPGAVEACNGIDDDCDGVVDDGAPTSSWWPDADGDGWGTATGPVESCPAPKGYAAQSGDCDDTDAAIYPGAEDDVGDGVDTDCDGDYQCETLVAWKGDLDITGPTALADAEAFCATYNAVEGGLYVYETDFEDLEALACVCDVGHNLWVLGNPEMSSLRGVERVTRLGGDLWVDDNPVLTSLSGLEQLQEVTENVGLSNLLALTSLESLASLRAASGLGIGNVAIADLRGLERVSGLDFVNIRECSDLETLDGLPQIASMSYLGLVYNPVLRDISALATLVEVREDRMSVSYNEVLASYAGLNSVEVLRCDVALGHDAAASFAGLEALREIEGRTQLYVQGKESLDGLGRLERVGGDLEIEGDEFTVSLAGMTSLTEVEADLILRDVPITEGLEGITSVGGGLFLTSNEHIVDLDGLSGLRTVGNNVLIDHNDALSSLVGLQGIESIAGTLYVADNPNITDEDAWALVDAIGEENIGGGVVIEDNGP